MLDTFLGRFGIQIEPVTVAQGLLAPQAFVLFGKSRHKAGLNSEIASVTLWPKHNANRCFSRAEISGIRI